MSRFSIVIALVASFVANDSLSEEVLEPKLSEAVRIYTLYKTTEHMSVMCRKWERHTSSAVDSAIAELLEKHAVKIAEANSVLNERFWQEQRRYLDESMASDRLALDEKFREAPEELRRDWCENFPERIELADRALAQPSPYTQSPENLPVR